MIKVFGKELNIVSIILILVCFTHLLNIPKTENFISHEIKNSIFVIFISFAWIAVLTSNRIEIKISNTITLFFFITIVLLFISAINSEYSKKSIRESILTVTILSVPLLFECLNRTRKFLIYTVILVSIFASIFCILENIDVKVIDFTQDTKEQRSGFFENRNILGGYLMISVFLTLLVVAKVQKPFVRLLLIFILVVELIGLGFSNTRLAWVGCIIGVIMLVVITIKRKDYKLLKFIVMGTVGGIIAILFFNFVKKNPISYAGRIYQMLDVDTRSFKARIMLAKISKEMIIENPVIGSGPGTFEICSDKHLSNVLQDEEFRYTYKIPENSHNIFFEFFTECGIIGGIAFTTYFVSLFVLVVKNYLKDKNTEHSIAVSCFCAFIIYSMGHSSFKFHPLIFVFFLVISNELTSIKIREKYLSLGAIFTPIFVLFCVIYVKNLVGNYHFYKAIKAEEEQNYEEALRRYKEGTHYVDDNYFAYAHTGHICELRGLWIEALKNFCESLRYHPYRDTVYVEIGEVYRKKGLLDVSVKYYERAIEIRPNNERAYLKLVRVLKELERKQDALIWCEKGLKMIPHSDSLRDVKKNLEKKQ